MEFRAPAKINLTLTVLGRRTDGFHEIESLIAPISLADTLVITPRESGGLTFVCDDASLPTDESNLVVRAARLFCAETGTEPNFHISLTKRIPHGAGLGGGSSDAAATLSGLNEVCGAKLPLGPLESMAATLGSDVPIFLHQSAAWVRGRGEKVEPCVLSEPLTLLLIKPPFGIPTPWAYRQWLDSRELPQLPYQPQPFSWGLLKNDLERPVFAKYLLLGLIKRWLLAQEEVAGALMSGSGATTFAILRSKEAAAALRVKFTAEFGSGYWLCEAQTVDAG